MSRLRMAFLGPPNVELDGAPVHLDTRKAVALLAYLAVGGEPVSRETLVTLLWSRYGRTGGHAALRRTLSTLRTALGATVLGAERETVSLSRGTDAAIDIWRLRELLALCEGHGHEHRAICRQCLPLLTEAAALLRGDFLSGFSLKDSADFDDWQFFTTERFRLESTQVLDRLVLCASAAGDFQAAVALARKRLALDRLEESAHAMLMQALAWEGNRAAARRAFQECEQVLARELDVSPQESTRRLARDISQGRAPDPPAFSEVQPRTGPDTPLFSESSPSTVIAIRVDASGEGQVSGLSSFGQSAVESISKLHGRVIEHSRAGVIAIFNDGRFLEANPELAVRAALEMRHHGSSWSLAVRGAVATGRLARVDDGPGDMRFAGRPLPLARLMAERSEAGVVTVDEPTWRLTRDAFSFAAGTGSTFRVNGIAPLSRKSRGPATEMFGRNEEADKLGRAWEKTVGGVGQVVVISGEAGIGKSRLVRELNLRAESAAGTGTMLWLEGRCLAPNANIGYWPFIDMIDSLLSQHPDHAVSPGSIDELLFPEEPEETRVFDVARAARELLEPSKAVPLGGETGLWTPEQVKHRAFRAVTLLFRGLARTAPLVLVFEDLHWADALSLELIESLLESTRGLRVLLVLVYRVDPDHRSRNLAAAAARRRIEDLAEIHLREITLEESTRMLDALVPAGALHPEERDDILLRCRGNPYFLEELARARSGAAGPAGAGEAPDGSRATLTAGIKAVVLSRFFNLSETEREVLSHAAVIGRVFLCRLLTLAVNRTELAAVLEDLEDRELLFVERSVPEVEYSFKHVLTQEAVYESLPEEERTRIHRKVAAAYEQLSPSARFDFSESLAHHYDCGREPHKAIESYYVSGEKARRVYANGEAVAHFTRGLELLRALPQGPSSLEKELEYLIALGVPLVLVKGHQDPSVEAVHLRAKAISEERGSAVQRFQVCLGLNRHYAYSRQRLHYGQQMLEIAADLNDPRLMSRAHGMLAESYFYFGDFGEMRSHAEAGLLHCTPAGSALDLVQFGNDTSAIVSITYSLSLWGFGLPARSLAVMQESLGRARTLGHAFTLCMVMFYASLLAFMLHDPQQARPLSEELFSIGQREGFALYVGYGFVLRGWSAGDTALIRRGIETLPHHPFPCAYACMLAELYLEEGRTTEAIQTLETALAKVRETHLHLWEPEVHRLRGEAGLMAGEADVDAGRWLERALRLSRKQGARSLELRALTSMYRGGPRRGSAEVRSELERVCRGFPEGTETAETRDARRLLSP